MKTYFDPYFSPTFWPPGEAPPADLDAADTQVAAAALAGATLADGAYSGGIPDFAPLWGQTADGLYALLQLATQELDAAFFYQGHQYDLRQELQFPRVAWGPPVNQLGGLIPAPGMLTPDTVIWDMEYVTYNPIVPYKVKLASLHQAAYLLSPTNRDRVRAIFSGLSGQGIGSLKEDYANAKDLRDTGALKGLSLSASTIMRKYQATQGRIV